MQNACLIIKIVLIEIIIAVASSTELVCLLFDCHIKMSGFILLKLALTRAKLEEETKLNQAIKSRKCRKKASAIEYPPNIKIDNICRICGEFSEKRLKSIFGDGSQLVDIAGDVMRVASVQLRRDDSLPKSICEECCLMLDDAVSFKDICEESDRNLREYVHKIQPHQSKGESDFNDEMDADNDDHHTDEQTTSNESAEELVHRADPVAPPIHCDKCNIFFTSFAGLQSHKKSNEHINRLWACNVCDKTFTRKSLHKSHCQVHRERKFLCEICGKKCLQNHELKRHIMSHRKDTPYHCKFCDYKTWDSCYLKLHQTIHTGQRRYSCPHCPKMFINNSNMKRHIEKHADPKPHHCSMCDMRYTTKYALRDHVMRAHDKILSLHCTHCDMIKSCKKDLQLHMSKVHKDVYIPRHFPTTGPILHVRSDQAIEQNNAACERSYSQTEPNGSRSVIRPSDAGFQLIN